jgi:hypothetical protein
VPPASPTACIRQVGALSCYPSVRRETCVSFSLCQPSSSSSVDAARATARRQAALASSRHQVLAWASTARTATGIPAALAFAVCHSGIRPAKPQAGGAFSMAPARATPSATQASMCVAITEALSIAVCRLPTVERRLFGDFSRRGRSHLGTPACPRCHGSQLAWTRTWAIRRLCGLAPWQPLRRAAYPETRDNWSR